MEGWSWWDFCLASLFGSCSNSGCACRRCAHVGVTIPQAEPAPWLPIQPPRSPGVLDYFTPCRSLALLPMWPRDESGLWLGSCGIGPLHQGLGHWRW